MIKVGDKITLKKPMGDFKMVGTVCTVTKVNDGLVSFCCQYGTGGVTMDELKQYFAVDEQDKESENTPIEKKSAPFEEGDRVVLMHDAPTLTPMKKGDRFIIEKLQYGVAILSYDGDEDTDCMFNISQALLMGNFEVVEEEECEGWCAPFAPVTEEDINNMLASSEVKAVITFGRCAVVTCKLPCGFILASDPVACVDEDEFDEEYAISLCTPKIKEKIRKFETYRRLANVHECCACCGECEEDF